MDKFRCVTLEKVMMVVQATLMIIDVELYVTGKVRVRSIFA